MPKKKNRSKVILAVAVFSLLLAAAAVLACLASRGVYVKKDAA